MRAKVFQASGAAEIEALDGQITDWLSDVRTIEHMSTAMCQVADNPNGERWQHLVVTIFYTVHAGT